MWFSQYEMMLQTTTRMISGVYDRILGCFDEALLTRIIYGGGGGGWGDLFGVFLAFNREKNEKELHLNMYPNITLGMMSLRSPVWVKEEKI